MYSLVAIAWEGNGDWIVDIEAVVLTGGDGVAGKMQSHKSGEGRDSRGGNQPRRDEFRDTQPCRVR